MERKSSSAKNSPINAFLPVLGFLLIVSLGAVAYLVSGPAHRFLLEQDFGIPANTEVQFVIAGILWLLLMLTSYMLYALFAPKPDKIATERHLKVEKAEKQKEDLARKKRQQELNRKVARERAAKSQEANSGKKR